MIKNFNHKGLKRFFTNSDTSKIQQSHIKRLRNLLTFLNAAEVIEDINFPGSDLHKLSGDRKEFWAISISGNWRLIFRFKQNSVYDLDYIDYH